MTPERKPTALDICIDNPDFDGTPLQTAARRELQVLRELCDIIMELQDGPGSECTPNPDETERFIKATDAYRNLLAEQEKQS